MFSMFRKATYPKRQVVQEIRKVRTVLMVPAIRTALTGPMVRVNRKVRQVLVFQA
jgi:hypothetical protein